MKTSIKIKIAKYLSKILISFFSSNHITTKRNDIIWKLDLNEAIDLSIFIFGKFEPSIHKIVKKLLVDDSKVKDIIDIGANCGSHTLNFAYQFQDKRIFAIEPTQYCYEKLTKNIDLNPELKKNITVVQGFLSNKNLLPDNIYSSWDLSSKQEKHKEHKGVKKTTTNSKVFSLDEFTEIYKISSSLIKCDVDGNELFVFESGKNYLKKYKPKIVMELAPYLYEENNYKSYDLFQLIRSYGYNFYNTQNFKKIHSIEEYASKIRRGSSKNIYLA